MAIVYMYHALEGVDCVTRLVEVDPNMPCENYEQTRVDIDFLRHWNSSGIV
jgi:hypothetical protein